MYRGIVEANQYGPEEFDRLEKTYISSLLAHKNRYGTMTEVYHLLSFLYHLLVYTYITNADYCHI